MKEYFILSHKFIGYGPEGMATYEITFNKSLENTLRFTYMEDGLNAGIEKELRNEVKESIPNVWRSFITWIRYILNKK